MLQSPGTIYSVLRVRRVRSRVARSRWKLFVAKPADLEWSTLRLLERTANRAGGVVVHPLFWYPREKKVR